MELKDKLISVLNELKLASLTTGDNPKPLMDKYNMLFLGEKFNEILTIELVHCLSHHFDFDISLHELHDLIPDVCKSLGMKYDVRINVEDCGKTNPPIAAYAIYLF